MDDKKIESFLTGYLIGQKIKKVLETILGIILVVFLWFIPLWLLNLLGIGHS